MITAYQASVWHLSVIFVFVAVSFHLLCPTNYIVNVTLVGTTIVILKVGLHCHRPGRVMTICIMAVTMIMTAVVMAATVLDESVIRAYNKPDLLFVTFISFLGYAQLLGYV